MNLNCRILLLTLLVLVNSNIYSQSLKKAKPTTLDSLQGEWVMAENKENRLIFKKDTIYIFSDNQFVSKDKFYLSYDIIKSKAKLKSVIKNGTKNGPFLMIMDSYEEFDDLLLYVIESISKDTLEFGYSKRHGAYTYYRKGTKKKRH